MIMTGQRSNAPLLQTTVPLRDERCRLPRVGGMKGRTPEARESLNSLLTETASIAATSEETLHALPEQRVAMDRLNLQPPDSLLGSYLFVAMRLVAPILQGPLDSSRPSPSPSSSCQSRGMRCGQSSRHAPC